jgi:hypothetical protein
MILQILIVDLRWPLQPELVRDTVRHSKISVSCNMVHPVVLIILRLNVGPVLDIHR